MLSYFLVFTLLGLILGKLLVKDKALLLIVVVSILWGVSSGPIWGLATLGELFLGFYIANYRSL